MFHLNSSKIAFLKKNNSQSTKHTRAKKMAGQKLKKHDRYKEEQNQRKSHSHIDTRNNNINLPTRKMTKENKSTEHAEQRERRLEILQRQGTSLCPNDTRFLLIRQASRLSEDNQRIFYTKVIKLAEAAKQGGQTQERLQQANKNDDQSNNSKTEETHKGE